MSLHPLNNLRVDYTLDSDEVRQTASSIIAMQTRSGAIPKTIGGQIDPWNHLEAAMALIAAGCLEEAEKSILWLANMQNIRGFWYCAYDCQNQILDYTIDTNQCMYIAVAVLHYYLSTKDNDFLVKLWPVVLKAMDFVSSLQRESGSIPWSIQFNELDVSDEGDTARNPRSNTSLFAASCSVYHSFKAVFRLVNILEDVFTSNEGLARSENPGISIDNIQRMQMHTTVVLIRLQKSLTDCIQDNALIYSEEYINKSSYAMERYYPLMTGLISEHTIGMAAEAKDLFILKDWGVRCLLGHDWFTTAETAEWAIAEACIGNIDTAKSLLRSTYRHRLRDGYYLTGSVCPSMLSFPDGEKSSYSAAAVILANDVLTGGIAKDIFAPL